MSVQDRHTSTALPPMDELLSAGDLKACCAAVYGHPIVGWLLGDELHPGGEATTRRALELIAVGPEDRLLDVASGTGTSALLGARELGCSVVGVEYSEQAVHAARAAAEAEGLRGKVSFRRADAEALPFTDGEFDAVLCECSLCVFGDKRRAVAEMRRVLRAGGRLALSDVLVDRRALPAELDGPLAAVACVGEALSREGYEEILVEAGFRVGAIERRDGDAAALAQRAEDRLRGARLLGVDRLEGAPIATADAIELVRVARRAISEGSLGYAIFAVDAS